MKTIAAKIASNLVPRIPEMVKDSAINNEGFIARIVEAELGKYAEEYTRLKSFALQFSCEHIKVNAHLHSGPLFVCEQCNHITTQV